MFGIGWVLGAPALAAECVGRHEAAAVTSALEQAMTRWVVDRAGFEATAAEAVGMADCLVEPASPALAGLLHRVGGLRQIAAGAEDRAVPYLAAAMVADPAVSLAAAMAPVDQLWARAVSAPRPPRAPLNLSMNARVDGLVTDDRPAEGPYLLQVESAGRVAYSVYLVDQAPALPPGLRSIAATEQAMAPVGVRRLTGSTSSTASRAAPVKPSGGGSSNKGLLWAGVVSGGLAAGMYGTAAVARLQYDQGPTNTTHTLTNGAYFGSIGTAALSGAFLTTFLVTR